MTVSIWGQEQLVNVTTKDTQFFASTGVLANGDLAIAWIDYSVAGFPTGDIRARIYAPDGTPRTGEFAIATTAASELSPEIVPLADGSFRVFYEQANVLKAPVYNANGTLKTASNTGYVASTADAAGVSLGTGGAFALVRSFDSGGANGDDVFLDIFNTAGALTSTTTVQSGVGRQYIPDVKRLANGNLVVTWTDQAANGVKAHIYTAAGASVYPEFVVASGAQQAASQVVALGSGGFAIVWQEYQGPSPSDGYDVKGRVYDAAGAPQGSIISLSSHIIDNQSSPKVVALEDGGFLSVWSDNNFGVRGQQFDIVGNRVGTEFQVSSGFGQSDLDLSLLSDGRVAATFSDTGLGDSSGSGVHLVILDPRNGQVQGSFVADLLYGGDFDDQIVAKAGADVVYAGFGNDHVFGGDDGDALFGQGGNDLLYGQDGTDTLNGGSGDDLLDGGLGFDVASYMNAVSGVSVDLAIVGEQRTNGSGVDILVGIEGLMGSNDIDILRGNNAYNQLYGMDGNDAIFGLGGDDFIAGGGGADMIVAGDGNDTVTGGDGNDQVLGGIGNDTISGDDGDDSLSGEDGDDQIQGGAGSDGIAGGAGVDGIAGGNGNDALYGEAGNDVINGGAGSDYIVGGLGRDYLIGGTGEGDRFAYTNINDSTFADPLGRDYIADFEHGLDVIDLSAVKTSAAASFALSVVGADTYVFADVNGDGQSDFWIILQNVTNVTNSDILL